MLTIDPDDPEGVPYFAWDRPITNAEIRSILATGPEIERIAWMSRILREARVPDVWRYLGLRHDVLPNWERLRPTLGRRRALWEYLIEGWRRDGLAD
ncbi:MAG: hypothetical protein H0V89_11235 [Deltaproteobacteria bacterium]|nr:hypothetical protein [Deltaproteobacteria bacterium]